MYSPAKLKNFMVGLKERKEVISTSPIEMSSSAYSIDEGANDADNLANMGYDQELHRSFSKWEVFGLAFSIMSLGPALSSTLTYGLTVGGAGLTWGWFVPMCFVMTVAIAMSELSSTWPTAGSMYYWTFQLSPPKWRRFLSYFSGWADLTGLWFGCASVFYGFTKQLLSSVQLGVEQYEATDSQRFGVYAASLVLSMALCNIPGKVMAKIQTVSIYFNIVAVCILVIALPVGLRIKGIDLNSGSDVFGSFQPGETNYPQGWAFMLGWMLPIYCAVTLDTSTHLSEETNDAARSVPFSVMLSCGLCFGLGFIIVCVLAAVINWSDITTILDAELPLAVIITRCLNKEWSIAIMSLFTFIQFFMGLSTMYANSRQCFALARDNALPFSGYLRRVDKLGTPYYAILCTFIIALCLGLLILAGDVAAEAIFSMSVTSLYMGWSIPIWLYAYDRKLFHPGPFYLGNILSRVNSIIASAFCFIVIFLLTLFPADIPVKDPADMNWSIVVCAGVWLIALCWFFIHAHKVYHGPAMAEEEGSNIVIEGGEVASGEKTEEKIDTGIETK